MNETLGLRNALHLAMHGHACKHSRGYTQSGAKVRDELTALLQALEHEMRAMERWEETPPPADALNSKEPFAVDTLDFDQWLQWILVPRLNDLLRRQLPLPGHSAIRPMAEEVYAEISECERLVTLIGDIDDLLNCNCEH